MQFKVDTQYLTALVGGTADVGEVEKYLSLLMQFKKGMNIFYSHIHI